VPSNKNEKDFDISYIFERIHILTRVHDEITSDAIGYAMKTIPCKLGAGHVLSSGG
jgi:hypothetical protein